MMAYNPYPKKYPSHRQVKAMLVGLEALASKSPLQATAGTDGLISPSSASMPKPQQRPLQPIKTKAQPNTPRKNKRHGGAEIKPNRITEAGEQAALVQWARLNGLLILAIPNGAKRSAWAGEREKALGLLPGASDLLLAEPRQGFHGYFIEMKAPGKKPRPNQLEFMALVRARNYKAEWFDNFVEARQSVELYLG